MLSDNLFSLPETATGFPSPAETCWEPPLNLQDYLLPHPAATYIFQLRTAWPRFRLQTGMLLLVDRALRPQPQCLILQMHEGAFRLVRFDGSQAEVWGVITHAIQRYL